MSKNIKLLISEVSRINDLMLFTENREIINESMSTIIKSLRTLVKNSADEIAQYGSRELDNLVNLMKKSKSSDDFFTSLNSMKSFNDDVAKQLRRDIFDILPEATQTRIKNIVQQLEDNKDKLSDEDTIDFINSIIEAQFKNEPESVKSFLKDCVLDNSDILASKAEKGNLSKLIDSLTDEDVTNELDKLLMTDDEIRDAFKSENHWSNNDFTRLFVDKRRDATRALQAYKIDDATKSILKGKTKKEIRELVKKEIKENLEGNEELMNILKNRSALARWSRLPMRYKVSIMSLLFLGGHRWIVLGGGLAWVLRDKSYDSVEFVEEIIEEFETNLDIKEQGLFTKLIQNEEEKIVNVLKDYDADSLPNDMFNEHGNLVSNKYMINYSDDEKSLQILDINNDYTPVKEYSLDQINTLIKNNQ